MQIKDLSWMLYSEITCIRILKCVKFLIVVSKDVSKRNLSYPNRIDQWSVTFLLNDYTVLLSQRSPTFYR